MPFYDFDYDGFPGEYVYGDDLYIFNGQTEAADALGISVASISNVLNGKQRIAKGYIFEYMNEEELHETD